jgi:hypothetical protein
VVAANALLGINQGFAWSMTVIMKVDLVGPKSRRLAVGLNEFAGYLSVGLTAFLTGYIAERCGLRPEPLYLGIGYAALGLVLSTLLVRDTRHQVGLEISGHAVTAEAVGFHGTPSDSARSLRQDLCEAAEGHHSGISRDNKAGHIG